MEELSSGTESGEFQGPWAHTTIQNKTKSSLEVACPCPLSPNFSPPPLLALRPSSIGFAAFFRANPAKLKFIQAVGKTFVSEEKPV